MNAQFAQPLSIFMYSSVFCINVLLPTLPGARDEKGETAIFSKAGLLSDAHVSGMVRNFGSGS